MAARLREAEEKIKVLHTGMRLARVAALKWLGASWGVGVASELGDIDLVCPKTEGRNRVRSWGGTKWGEAMTVACTKPPLRCQRWDLGHLESQILLPE